MGNALKDGRPKFGLGNGLGALRVAVRFRAFYFFSRKNYNLSNRKTDIWISLSSIERRDKNETDD